MENPMEGLHLRMMKIRFFSKVQPGTVNKTVFSWKEIPMKNTVIASFEGEKVKIVSAAQKKNTLFLQSAKIIPLEDFDAFLNTSNNKTYTVVNNFKEYYSDILLIPFMPERYFAPVLKSEIEKRISFLNFSFIYHIISEKKASGGQKEKEVFVFAVKNEEIEDILKMFLDKRITVTSMYPDIFSVAMSIKFTDKSVLCVTETGGKKNILLIKEGKINLIRSIPAINKGIYDSDIQNFNMTVNYCRQTLKTTPSNTVLTGSLCSDYFSKLNCIAPLMCCIKPPINNMPEPVDTLEFFTPLTALYLNNRHAIDIMPMTYKRLAGTRRMVKGAAIVCLVLTICSSAVAAKVIKDLYITKEKIVKARSSLPEIEQIINSYEEKKGVVDGYSPAISLLQKAEFAPSLKSLFVIFSTLSTKGITISLIDIKVEPNGDTKDGKIMARFEGKSHDNDFIDMQISYQEFIESIKKHKDITVTADNLEFNEKHFFVEVVYH